MREVAIVRILNSNKTKTRPTNDVLKAAFGALNNIKHGLRTPGEEIAFTARLKIHSHSHSQIFRYGRSIFCLPHRPKFSDFFDLCLQWVSVVHDCKYCPAFKFFFFFILLGFCIIDYTIYFIFTMYSNIYSRIIKLWFIFTILWQF